MHYLRPLYLATVDRLNVYVNTLVHVLMFSIFALFYRRLYNITQHC